MKHIIWHLLSFSVCLKFHIKNNINKNSPHPQIWNCTVKFNVEVLPKKTECLSYFREKEQRRNIPRTPLSPN